MQVLKEEVQYQKSRTFPEEQILKPGSYVHVYLVEPSERWWGRLLELSVAGVTLRGINVDQIEAFKYQFNNRPRAVFPLTVFFPMRRIQKVDLDESWDELPSILDGVVEVTGLSAEEILPLDQERSS